MNVKHCVTTLLACAGMAALPAISLAAESSARMPGKTTQQSSTWDFRGEASTLLSNIQVDADKAQRHASNLDAFVDTPLLSWQAHAAQLTSIRREINDMGRKLSRLEVIRREVAPWQREAIDRIALPVRLMADNAQDAINFLNNNQGNFWMPAYGKYVANLDRESDQVSHSIRNFTELAKVRTENLQLRNKLGLKARS